MSGYQYPIGGVISAQGDLQHPSNGVNSVLSGYQHLSGEVICVQGDLQHPSSGIISVLSINFHPSNGICIPSSGLQSTGGDDKCYYILPELRTDFVIFHILISKSILK